MQARQRCGTLWCETFLGRSVITSQPSGLPQLVQIPHTQPPSKPKWVRVISVIHHLQDSEHVLPSSSSLLRRFLHPIKFPRESAMYLVRQAAIRDMHSGCRATLTGSLCLSLIVIFEISLLACPGAHESATTVWEPYTGLHRPCLGNLRNAISTPKLRPPL